MNHLEVGVVVSHLDTGLLGEGFCDGVFDRFLPVPTRAHRDRVWLFWFAIWVDFCTAFVILVTTQTTGDR
ncbi:hypothetical protein D8S78_23735 [Natrialba swarupiae]|nr:hypothetical protein [Natrialba swarupiae]